MRRLLDEIDLHIAVMLLFFPPGWWWLAALLRPPHQLMDESLAVVCMSWWWLAVPLLAPQGRVYVRAFWDYPTFGKRPWAYLAANELLILGTVGALAWMRAMLI
jgi:hypothetical protein